MGPSLHPLVHKRHQRMTFQCSLTEAKEGQDTEGDSEATSKNGATATDLQEGSLFYFFFATLTWEQKNNVLCRDELTSFGPKTLRICNIQNYSQPIAR